MEHQVLTLLKESDLPLAATVYESVGTPSGTVLYLHGGGLIFGDRDDLPTEYIEKIVGAGKTFVALDYPLAPETKLDQTLSILQQAIAELHQLLNLDNLILMGRSAGSYLGYLLIKNGLQVDKFVDLYGYYDITLPEFKMPSAFYNKLPKVAPMEVQAMVASKPVLVDKGNNRYPIYISGRQFGTWLSLFLPDVNQADQYSLTEEDLKDFPPTLILHCIGDPDVPFKIAQKVNTLIEASTLIVITKEEHDFDRVVTPETLKYYDQVVRFMG